MTNIGRHLTQAEVRRRALADVERQLQAGTLVIRQMTPEERERWLPKNLPARRRRRAQADDHGDDEEGF